MTTRFDINLLRPGASYRSRSAWFLGASGGRHLAAVAATGVALVVAVGAGAVLPRSLRYADDVRAIARLQQEVARSGAELESLRETLRGLSAEARRQVRWSELLPALSRRLPEPLHIERVSLGRSRPPSQAPAQPGAATAGDLTLEIEATAAVVPGSSRLVDVANLMAGLAQDPAVAQQFQLRSWEVRPRRDRAGSGALQILVAFTEKRS